MEKISLKKITSEYINSLTHDQARELGQELRDNTQGRVSKIEAKNLQLLANQAGLKRFVKNATTSVKPTSTQDKRLMNTSIDENEAFRYVRLAEMQENIITTLSTTAHHIYLSLQLSPLSNSLGIFRATKGEIAAFACYQSANCIDEALNELQAAGKIRYLNGFVFLNHFRHNQKSVGNKSNLQGYLKLYNKLPYNVKLPFKPSYIIDNNTPLGDLLIMYDELVNLIELYGQMASNQPVMRLKKNYQNFIPQMKLTASSMRDLRLMSNHMLMYLILKDIGKR